MGRSGERQQNTRTTIASDEPWPPPTLRPHPWWSARMARGRRTRTPTLQLQPMTFSFTALCRCVTAHAGRPLRAGHQLLALTVLAVLAVLTIIAPALLAALPASGQ